MNFEQLNKRLAEINELLLTLDICNLPNPNESIPYPKPMLSKYLSKELYDRLDDDEKLFNYIYNQVSNRIDATRKGLNYSPFNQKALHVVNSFAPHNVNGYSVRLMQVYNYLSTLGWEQATIAKPGFPANIKGVRSRTDMKTFNNINHYCHNFDMREGLTPFIEYTYKFVEAIINVAEIEHPSILHAASNYTMGIAAAIAAKILRIPCIYEIRGRWELTRLTKDEKFIHTPEYTFQQALEKAAINNSNHVITISHALKDYIVERGADIEVISVVQNCIDAQSITVENYNEKLAKKLKVKDNLIIGYAGAIIKAEGLDSLIEAVSILKNQGVCNVKVLILGDGPIVNDLKKDIISRSLENNIILLGKVRREDIAKYYSIFDICVLPRVSYEVCKIVPPIKIFECMAYKKPIIASDLPVLREFLSNDNGMIYGNSPAELAKTINLFITNPDLVKTQGEKAYNWLINHHKIETVFHPYSEIYKLLSDRMRTNDYTKF